MTTNTLYGQAGQSPSGADSGSSGTLGLHFTVSAASTLAGIWFYSPSGFGLTQLPTTIALYTTTATPTTGTLVTSNAASWSGAAGSGWVFAAFTSPPTLASGTNYMASAFRNDAVNPWFVFTTTATWPKTSGIITAPEDVSTGQGWFVSPGTSLAFPSSQNAGFSWFLDVSVSTGTTHTATGSLTVTPSFSAVPSPRTRSAGLTVTPSFSAAAEQFTHSPSASLTVAPSFSAADVAAHVRSASLTVTPVLSASRVHRDVRHAALTVRPVLLAAASHAFGAPPGYPVGDLGAMVELLLDGTWTDITTAALPDGQQEGSIKSGQPASAQQPNPAAMNGSWDNPDFSLSPRNTAGPYFGELRQNTPVRVSVNSPYGAYLRLENDNEDLASVADTSALHITGSIEIRVGLRLSDWRATTIAARNDGTTASWSLILNSNGTLSFFWFDSGGTLRHVDSPAAVAVSWGAFRATMDATNGNCQFYVSDSVDGSWFSLGAAASGTSGAATTIRAGNSPLVVGWSGAGQTQMRGQVSDFRLYSGIGGTVVADAKFSAQIPGITTWTDVAGRTWTLSGGAELTGRDYRLHGEVSSLAPTADVSSSVPKVAAQLSGRLRRLQQGYAPTVESAMRRAVLTQPGTLAPVAYWPMEDGQVARSFGPAVGTQLLTAGLGTVRPAADSSFEASAPLPQLNGDSLTAVVSTYTGATAWAVRFLFKEGQTLPASGSCRLIEITTTGACTTLRVSINADGSVNFTGLLSGGSTAFSFTEVAYPQLSGPAWWSVEAVPSGSNVEYNLVSIAPGAGGGNQDPSTVTGHGSFGIVTQIEVNPDLILTDTVFGHLSVQKAWTSMFTLGAPLNAWRTELAGDRFARICAEQGITCRILGRPSSAQAMGAQPRGSAWTILRDCAQTEQGIIYEPRDCFGLGFRTAESLGAQTAGLTLSFADSNLPGDVQPADNDDGLLNDVTASMPDGTTWRAVLDDGTSRSVSEPEDGGAGRYAGSPPFSFNLADASQLDAATALYLARSSTSDARYANVTANFGIDGAPTAAMARLRPGDLVVITDVPALYQSADIHQLAMGATEAFGPGRKITWDCVPSSPYGA